MYYQAALGGLPSAMDAVGKHYLYKPEATDVDFASAWSWLEKAANLGMVKARHRLAWMKLNGLGMQVNYKDAVVWCCGGAQAVLERGQKQFPSAGGLRDEEVSDDSDVSSEDGQKEHKARQIVLDEEVETTDKRKRISSKKGTEFTLIDQKDKKPKTDVKSRPEESQPAATPQWIQHHTTIATVILDFCRYFGWGIEQDKTALRRTFLSASTCAFFLRWPDLPRCHMILGTAQELGIMPRGQRNGIQAREHFARAAKLFAQATN